MSLPVLYVLVECTHLCVCACECVHSVPEWEFMSDLIDGDGIGGSAPLIEATGSTRLLINL